VSNTSRIPIALVSAACGLTLAAAQWRPLPPALLAPAGYLCLAVLPGLALLAWLGRDFRGIGAQAAALGLGPVVSGSAISLLMLAGLSVAPAATAAGVVFAVAAAASACMPRRRDSNETSEAQESGAKYAWLIAIVGVAIVAVFPLMGEASRLRSDAWFHVAVIYQIRGFGLPPTDPFFSGLALQYMWVYHVYTAALAEAASMNPSWAMAAVNLQAVACLALATFALSASLRGGPAGAALSSAFVLVGMNGLFWVFLPFKLARALVGNVKGWNEVVRQFSLLSLDMTKVRAFASVSKSQPFLLDKFIVATAFSLGVCLSVVFALLAFRFIANGRPSTGALAAFSMAGIALYHTPTAVAFGGAAGLALVVTAIHSPKPYSRRALALILWMGLAAAMTAPYLYNVSSGKEATQLIPLGLSTVKFGCIFISCASALLFGGPTILRFLRSPASPQHFYGLFAAAAVLVSLVLVLPGPNTFDKTPFFAFLPLAPVAGWGILAAYRRGSTPSRRALLALACRAARRPRQEIRSSTLGSGRTHLETPSSWTAGIGSMSPSWGGGGFYGDASPTPSSGDTTRMRWP
jgi:hypothetical protein